MNDTNTKPKFLFQTRCPECAKNGKDTKGNNLAVYEGSTGYCFSCTSWFRGLDTQGLTRFKPTQGYRRPMAIEELNYDPETVKSDRGVTADTFRKYSTMVTDDEHVYPYFDKDNKLIAVMRRDVKNKLFATEPSGSGLSSTLWGAHLFPKGSGNTVILTEGQLDAMSAYQMLSGRFPVVSLPNGANSVTNCIKENFDYLNSFNTIILALDNDDQGRKAGPAIARKFAAGKVKIVEFPSDVKDANDILWKKKEPSLFNKLVLNAKVWTPQGVTFLDDVIDSLLDKRKKEPMVPYPWEGLNDMLFGMYAPSLVTITAGTGSGKSSILRELAYYLYRKTSHKIGMMFLEESLEDTVGALMSLELGRSVSNPKNNFTEEELREAHKKLCGNRFIMFSEFATNDIEEVVEKITYMAKVADCKYVFLDHLSILVSAQENGDERKAIDSVMTRLRALCQQANITLFVVSHLRRNNNEPHEEGGAVSLGDLRGSQSIAQLSDVVISLERNQQDLDENRRNTTLVRVLKSRRFGATGLASALFYDKHTCRISEVDLKDFLNPGAEDTPAFDNSNMGTMLKRIN